MRLSDDDRAVLARLRAAERGMIARTVGWCAINSGSRNVAGLLRMADRLDAAFSAVGAVERVALTPVEDVGADGRLHTWETGPCLRVTMRPEAPVQVVLTGHYDTVFPEGSAFDRVVERTDGALHGPGVADMKGGLSVMLGALEAFATHPLAERVGWRVLLSPDEEIGSLSSGPELARIAEGAHIGLTFEPALADGALASSRKGSGNFSVVVTGRAAHAGRDFASGRNAVAAAARIGAALDAANGAFVGVTLNVARIDGGAPLNQVPDGAVVRFNVRMLDEAGHVWVREAIDRALEAGQGDGLTVTLHGGFTRPPKPVDAAQQQLFDAVREAAGLLDQALSWKPSGGVCEGNNLFAAGLPNLDTLGVRGGDIHTTDEHAWPESFGERAALSAVVLAKLADGAIDGRAIRLGMG